MLLNHFNNSIGIILWNVFP